MWFTHLNTEHTLIVKNETLNNSLGLDSILENKTLTELPLETLSVGEDDEGKEKGGKRVRLLLGENHGKS